MAKNRFKNASFEASDIAPLLRRDIRDIDSLPLDKQERVRFAQDTRHRKTLVVWMMFVVSIWLLSVLFITSTNSVLKLNVSDSVLMTLLATTTVTVLGLANIILNGLFGGRRKYRKNPNPKPL